LLGGLGGKLLKEPSGLTSLACQASDSQMQISNKYVIDTQACILIWENKGFTSFIRLQLEKSSDKFMLHR